jgi:hypothetical protein
MDDRGVTFATKCGKTVTVAADEFIRRFLLHVLPARFVKIRHYGLMAAGNATTRLEVARALLRAEDPPPGEPPAAAPANPAADWRERLLRLTGIDLTLCPRCKAGRMIRRPLPAEASVPPRWDTS